MKGTSRTGLLEADPTCDGVGLWVRCEGVLDLAVKGHAAQGVNDAVARDAQLRDSVNCLSGLQPTQVSAADLVGDVQPDAASKRGDKALLQRTQSGWMHDKATPH